MCMLNTVSTKPQRSAQPLSGSVIPRRCWRLETLEASDGRVRSRSLIPDGRFSASLSLSPADVQRRFCVPGSTTAG
ncbi:hypothetical protein CA606_00285 [Caulobacter vibrioides]|uniref:Uncharacterized protein n=1 Tax=Caulobacter vibrioides TaxID=155892 RepID=A0A290MFP9_CAUVI|nr:hypothetical protein CA606_00285 [Caulobacter vibrioides]